MAHHCTAVAHSRSKPSLPSLAPASQPAESQESFNLDNVSGSDEPAQVDHGNKIKVNDPDAITLPKVPTSDVLYFFNKSAVGERSSAKCACKFPMRGTLQFCDLNNTS